MSNADIAQNYMSLLNGYDYEAAAELMHPEITARYPQSGEVFQGRDTYRAMFEAFPDPPDLEVVRTTHDEAVVHVASPMPFGSPVITVVGSGATFVGEGTVRYRSGDVWNFVTILRVQEGLIKEETTYFAESFDAPEWRKPYCEVDTSEGSDGN